MVRTDEQKIAKAPIEVTFGEKKYQIKPLTLLKAQEWRKELNTALGPIADSFQATHGLVSKGLTDALLAFPEKVADLLFLYAPELPKEEILASCTDEQMTQAFQDLMVIAYPFIAPLLTVVRLIRPTTTTQ